MNADETVIPTVDMDEDYHPCPACNHHALMASRLHAVTSDGVQLIGGLAVCSHCGWSPYRKHHHPWPTTEEVDR